MAMDLGAVKFLLSAFDMGYTMNSFCSLGRQALYANAKDLANLLREHGRCPADFWEKFPWRKPMYFADDLFQALDFETVESVDNSTYESASIVLDMNEPVPESMHGRYDVVFDGGTLEHIFNFPVALASSMKMVKPGGHLMLYTPTNNQCGHGFYQFSPELHFRVFSPENGFELIRIYLYYKRKYYHIVDPVVVHGRVELITQDGAMMLVHARRIADIEPFSQAPQQSDYLTAWDRHTQASDAPAEDGRLKGFLRSKLSEEQVAWISRRLNSLRRRGGVRNWKRNARVTNRRFFVPVTRWDVPTAEVTGAPTMARAGGVQGQPSGERQ